MDVAPPAQALTPEFKRNLRKAAAHDADQSARATLELPLRHVLALRSAIVRFLYSPK